MSTFNSLKNLFIETEETTETPVTTPDSKVSSYSSVTTVGTDVDLSLDSLNKFIESSQSEQLRMFFKQYNIFKDISGMTESARYLAAISSAGMTPQRAEVELNTLLTDINNYCTQTGMRINGVSDTKRGDFEVKDTDLQKQIDDLSNQVNSITQKIQDLRKEKSDLTVESVKVTEDLANERVNFEKVVNEKSVEFKSILEQVSKISTDIK